VNVIENLTIEILLIVVNVLRLIAWSVANFRSFICEQWVIVSCSCYLHCVESGLVLNYYLLMIGTCLAPSADINRPAWRPSNSRCSTALPSGQQR